MEDQEDVTVFNSSLLEDSFVIASPESEPLNRNNLYVDRTIDVVSAEDSIICIDEDDGSRELQSGNDIPLNLSLTSLPVTIPFTSGDLESSSVSCSNEDDDFFIVFEKKASPSEVQILENYIAPATVPKKKHRSQNPRPSIQTLDNDDPNSATVYTNLPLDDSITIVEGETRVPVIPSESQNNVLNRLQLLADESIEKKKRKIECGVCFDGPDEIEASDRSLVSTVCGHIFCSNCIKLAIKNSKQCPQCRKKLTMKQFHPLYV